VKSNRVTFGDHMRREMHAENFGGGHLFENVHLEDQENDVCITEMIKL
jgi:hypothetical protein